MRRKALVAGRDQGQHFVLTGQHSEVNAAHLRSPERVVASEFLSKWGLSSFFIFDIENEQWSVIILFLPGEAE